jgi:hypothetical protein
MEEKRKVQVKERLDSAARSVTGGREERPPNKGNEGNYLSLLPISTKSREKDGGGGVSVSFRPSQRQIKTKTKTRREETNKNSPEVERPPEKKKKKKKRKEESAGFDGFVRSAGQSVEKMRGDLVSNQITSHSNNHARQTTPLPPPPPLLLHLHLRLHQLGLHPGAFLLVLADGGAVEEVC